MSLVPYAGPTLFYFVDSNYILHLYHLFRCETVTHLFYRTIQGVSWAVLAPTIDFMLF